MSLFFLLNLLYMTDAALFLCAYGHQGFNKYIRGKTSYFNSIESQEELYISHTHPAEVDETMYLWHDISTHCYKFLTLNSKYFVATAKMTIQAICNECSVNITSPSLCPIWNIYGYGLDDKFIIIENEMCSPDNWDYINIPQKQPHNICTWNISENNDIVYGLNNEYWQLWSIDIDGNPYYYNKNNLLYIYQTYYQYDIVNISWYWVINDIIGLTHFEGMAYCEMISYGYPSINRCNPWYFANINESDNSLMINDEYIAINIKIRNNSCSFISNNICIYDSSILDINGDYDILLDTTGYNGYYKHINYYIRYDVDNKWKIGYPNNLSVQIYAICDIDGIEPFDIVQCNGYWKSIIHNKLDKMKIFNGFCSDLIITENPTFEPTINPITISPTLSPSVFLTHIPTKYPSESPTEIYDHMVFYCDYNDNDTNYYVIHITLSQYAELMEDTIKNTFDTINIDTENNDIFDIEICSVFDGILLNNKCPNNIKTQTKYKAIGTFRIMTRNKLMKYKKYIKNLMESDQFKIEFGNNMNDALNALDSRRRRLIENVNFEVVNIEIIDSFDYKENLYQTTIFNKTRFIMTSTQIIHGPDDDDMDNKNISDSSHDFYVILIIIFIGSLVFVSILVYCFTRNCVKKKYAKIGRKIEVIDGNNKDNVVINRNFVEIGKQNNINIDEENENENENERENDEELNIEKVALQDTLQKVDENEGILGPYTGEDSPKINSYGQIVTIQ